MDEVIDLCSGSPPERKRNKRRRGDNEQPSNPTKRAPPEEVELSDGDDELALRGDDELHSRRSRLRFGVGAERARWFRIERHPARG